MFWNESIDQKQYELLMQVIKKENDRYVKYIMGSLDFRLKQVKAQVSQKQYRYLLRSVVKYFRKQKTNKKVEIAQSKSNYFSDERIAIYSCITGGYDSFREPVIKPDNCDFYMITDREIDFQKDWKRISIDDVVPDKKMSAKNKNRYVKMHPEKIFTDYKYSIYIDGNIRPITDFTEFIQNVGECGVATFRHPNNDCAYLEAKHCIISKKVTKAEAEEHIGYLKEQNMPEHFGMADCGLIVREHNNQTCIKMMNEWWEQYLAHSKRDQISFAYVVYSNNLEMNTITVLGNNMYQNYAVRRLPHFVKE